MLEQEIASIIQFTLDKAGNPSPYYKEVPEGFLVPAAYFPPPEVVSGGHTLNTYALTYSMFIKFFHMERQGSHELALAVLTAIKERRGVIPLIKTDGTPAGRGFRLKDPEIKTINDKIGTSQLYLTWDSPRPYLNPESQKMMVYELNMYSRAAFEEVLAQRAAGPSAEDEP